MKNDLFINNNVVIPDHELEISTSRSGGPGGQHVNKSNTKITVRWNAHTTRALTDEQKARVIAKLQSRLTSEGDLIVHNSESRSQHHNKQLALAQLAHEIRKALHVPKKRIATKVSKGAKEARYVEKKHRGSIKKMRSKKFQEE